MDNSSVMRKQAQPIVRKAKKKQVKDEVDRIKQAEKKKRRLEKAIATSAAIRAELEKKKQMKKEGKLEAANEEDSADAAKKKQERDELERIKQAEKKTIRLEKAIATSAAIRVELAKKKLKKLEEQKRLDEEGAAIAEAVALHVLLGEDSDDSCQNMINQETGFKPWDYTTEFNHFNGGRNGFFPQQCRSSYAVQSNYRPRDSNWSSVSYEPFARGWDNTNMGISADLIAAQAVSSLQITENTDAIVFSGMFKGYQYHIPRE